MNTVHGFLHPELEKLNYQLEKDYIEARENPVFLQLVKKIPLADEILMKYTSSLEEASEEFNHCLSCKGLRDCQNKIMGHAYLPKSQQGNLMFEYQSCRFQKKTNQKLKHLKNVKAFYAAKDLENASIDQIDTRDKNRFGAINWLNEFIDHYLENPQQKGLYLYGTFGCGKSYLITAMFHELAKQNVKSAILFWPDYLRHLKASFDTDYKEQYESILKVPLLLIDDIGAETTTTWSRDEILCPLLQYRMENHLVTFFTSNMDLEMLANHFSISKSGVEEIKADRIIARIKQLTEPMKMISENRRK